ncbi:methyltransferase domain-containing protein [Prochlorococcus marinus]|uniref:methyltransferase domain-containing protein n=1 Tax=Prochlorococcus marinus TaxID=1219 RepID=UPI0022B3FB2C|nr:methyltransferase domain-containing protein [Prochlorococcus marinus]
MNKINVADPGIKGINLRTNDVSEAEIKSCRICGSYKLERALEVQSNPNIYFTRCTDCRITQCSCLPKKAFIENLYNEKQNLLSKTEVNVGDRLGHAASHIAKNLYRQLNNRDRLLNTKVIHVLDFGGGTGQLSIEILKKLRKLLGNIQFELNICDYSKPELKKNIIGIKTKSYRTLSDLPELATFDICIASSILEHVTDPINDLFIIISKINRDGIIYMRTPWIIPLAALLKRIKIKIDTLYPIHLYDMGGDFYEGKVLRKLINRNYKIVMSRTSFINASPSKQFITYILSAILKMPTYIFGIKWPFCGGWEVIFKIL